MGSRCSHARLFLSALFCALALAPRLSAQSPADGALAGRLLTQTGQPATYTRVLAIDDDSGVVQRTLTGRNGEFTIPRLPPGEYFLAVADSATVLPLEGLYEVHLGEVTSIVAHIGSSPASPIYAGYSEPVQLSAMPIPGDSWKSVALATPGANSASFGDSDASELTVAGLPPDQNSERNDGLSADDSFSASAGATAMAAAPESGTDEVAEPAAGPGTGSRSLLGDGRRSGSSNAFAQSAVREFRVRTQSDAAEYGSALYGHGAGAVVTLASRSGGTRLHGMVLYDLRNSAWSAANPFAIATTYRDGVVTSAQVKPHDLQQHFAARIGGPFVTQSARRSSGDIISRLSYLYAFERQLRDYPAISSPPTPSFYQLSAIQTALLANRGVSAAATRTALNYLSSLTGPAPRRADQTLHFARLDWMRLAGARVITEYNRVRWQNPGGTRSSAVVNRGTASLGSSYGSVDAAVARILLFPSPQITNELRLQYSHQLLYDTPQLPLAQEPAVGPGGFAPEVSIGPDGFAFGTPAALGRNAYPDERRLEAADVFAWVRGAHLVQLGGDFSTLRDFTNSLTNAEGTFTYDSGNTGGHAGGLVDWITDYTFGVNSYPNGGCPSIYAARHDFCFRAFSQSFGGQSLTWHTQQWAAFLQDDWHASSRLTVHLGARYEYEALPSAQHPNQQLDVLFKPLASTSTFPADRNNYGPRIGLAWQPFGEGRGVVRVGYGLYFGRLPGATVRAALLDTALPTSTTRIRITPSTEIVCPQQPQVGFGYPCSFLVPPSGVLSQSASAMMFSDRFQMPAIQQGTFSLERTVGWGILGSASYVMNIDRQLPSSVDLNIAPSTGMAGFQLVGGNGRAGVKDHETFYVPMYTGRRSSSFGPVTEILSNANATYNGLTLEARRGLGGRAGLGGIGRGLEFRLAWTWSKALDLAPESGSVPRINGQFDPFTNRYDKAISALNFPHRVVATVVWAPRANALFATELPALHTLLNSWSLASIFTESAGRPYSYLIFGGSRLPGGHESINGSGGSTVLPTTGRNTLRLPDTANLDLRLARSFAIGERLRARATADAFNLVNRVNYSGITQRAYIAGAPGTSGAPAGITPLVFQDAANIAAEGLNTLPFGTLTDSGAGSQRERRIQFGLRLEF